MAKPALSQSQLLQFKIRLASPRLSRIGRIFWDLPNLSEMFPEYLYMLFCSMRATVPLMERARERARELADSDPVAAQLADYFAKHIGEEMHHDEWMLDDLEVLGFDRTEILARLPPAEVAAMIGAQYYWIEHSHPISLLGCFAVLEGNPIATEQLDRFLAHTTIPQEAVRTLYKHAEIDPHHRDDLNRLIDRLPLQPNHVEMLGISALDVVHKLSIVIEAVVTKSQARQVA